MTTLRLTIEELPHSNVYRIYKKMWIGWWEIRAFESDHTPSKCVRRLERKFGEFVRIERNERPRKNNQIKIPIR